ncbi:MAG: DUF3301 domain-containing protein [Gammaproteobacteria bacterium]|nr:DUF3301 domain-containing protein [Gammaproteobacteria bacterium]
MDDLLLIILILAGIWYWWDTQQCNEIALFVCKKKCDSAGLQLLDASVSRQRSWLRRVPNGSIQICRLYSFEYSDDQSSDFGQRQQGYIVIIGKQVVETSMPHGKAETRQIH